MEYHCYDMPPLMFDGIERLDALSASNQQISKKNALCAFALALAMLMLQG
jgi:hypothetical protein